MYLATLLLLVRQDTKEEADTISLSVKQSHTAATQADEKLERAVGGEFSLTIHRDSFSSLLPAPPDLIGTLLGLLPHWALLPPRGPK